VLPDGTPVAASQLWSISFANPVDGAGLFSVGSSGSGSTTQLAVTDDAGRSWAAIGGLLPLAEDDPDDDAGIARASTSLAWSSPTQGYAWDATLIMRTSDGGRHWSQVPPPRAIGSATLTAAAVFSGGAWFSFDCPPTVAAGRCTTPLWSWSATAGWIPVPLPAASSPIVEVVRPSASEALVLGATPSGWLLVSEDDGATWSKRALPCSSLASLQPVVAPTPSPASVVAVGNALVLECAAAGGVGGGFQPLSFWSSTTDATTWRLQSDNVTPQGSPQVGTPPEGYGASLSTTPGTVWMAAGRGGLYLSADDGHVWTAVPALEAARSVGGGSVVFVDASHGWCLYNPFGVWLTSDGGVSWRLSAG
jgi:photosystem II stability/assembly factor-like uncharacterized protein